MSTSQELGTDKSETGTASTSQGANENNSVKDTVCEDEAGQINIKDHRGWRFWAVSTAMSTIVHELNIGSSYPWAINSFLLTSTCFQPTWGQLAELFGRRWITLLSVAIFVLGSGISGGATNEGIFLLGRALQGTGGGGINMLIDLIICDLVPLRERPRFIGIVNAVFAIGTSIGPFVGGALAQNHWRWVFYLNLPIGGVALGFLFIFLNVKSTKQTFSESLRRFDFIGSFSSISSTVAILFALTTAGAVYHWSSWRVIVPLVLGLVGLSAFHIYEATGLPAEPLIPSHLFGNRTSAIAFLSTFIHATIFVWIVYFLPVYFQAVLLSSPTRAGVQLLPTATAMIPFAIVAAVVVEKTGKYKPAHFAGLGLMAVGTGLLALLKENSSTGLWAGLQLIATAGLGALVPALLPAVQAGLTDADNASSTATWAYIRSFGAVWGVTIPTAIFNNQVSQHVNEITDPQVREVFSGGNAYEHGNRAFITSLDTTSQRQVVHVFVQSLKIVWIVGMVLCVANFLLVFFEKSIEMRKELDSKFGLEERPNAKSQEAEKVKDNAIASPTV